MHTTMRKKDDIKPKGQFSSGYYSRRESSPVRIGSTVIGGGNPVAVQTMTDTDTNDTEASLAQIGRIREAGCRIVRLTVQGMREAESLEKIAKEVRRRWPDMALVADVHFLPEVALAVAGSVDKVRINPGNYHEGEDGFDALLDKCAKHGTALRIGVNHGSLAPAIVEKYGDTPVGMVASAMEFLRRCREKGFQHLVVSMKSSNTRVMVQAYRLLIHEMAEEGMKFPIHLGVTETGNGMEGRIKSAAGIGALMADGIGDTVRVSLTESPENEIPVAEALVEYFAGKDTATDQTAKTAEKVKSGKPDGTEKWMPGYMQYRNFFDVFNYKRRLTSKVGRVGNGNDPLIWSELGPDEAAAVAEGKITILVAVSENPVAEWRKALAEMEASGDRRPVILGRTYTEPDPEKLAIKTAADFGVMFIDGLADGIRIDAPADIPAEFIKDLSLNILQASRARISKTEFIACPGCGRTLFDLQGTLEKVKTRTSHLKGLKIAVMGCIVNGPGEMADADYGYVGAAPGHITLYRAKTPVKKNIPQESALEELISLLMEDGKWFEP